MTSSFFAPQLLARIERTGVIAVLILEETRHAVPLAKALAAGGVDIMELTLRTAGAVDAIAAIHREVPEMLVGAGTVIFPEQVRAVVEAGATFAVSPGVNPRVIEETRKIGLPFAPGVATPTDIETALALGCRELKFFPAEPSGGLKYLASIAAPYAHLGVRFIPLGGISASNAADYLRDPLILAIGGSWLAPKDLVAAENWPAITARAQEARRIVQEVRGRSQTQGPKVITKARMNENAK